MSKASPREPGKGWANLGNVRFYTEPGAPRATSVQFDWNDGGSEPMVRLDFDVGKNYWRSYWVAMPVSEAKRLLAELMTAIKEKA